jgi:ATP-dependent DNA helicase RecQ
VEELKCLHLIRYPAFETIKIIYEALVNYLQIPVHQGQDKSYDFRFDDFIRNFKLGAHQALYSLQALESDGWIEYNEKAFTPATLVFTTSKQLLYEFYKSHPEYEATLISLLRAYEGIFDFPAFVSEVLIAKLLRKNEKEVKEELLRLTSFGIIRYTAQNDAPQLIFRKNRVVVSDLQMNLSQYYSRKEVFVQRVQKMICYIQTSSCRSLFIGHYFGDEEGAECGVCDNCLAKKKLFFSSEEFTNIATAITQHLSQKPLSADNLFIELRSVEKEKAWQVLQFLQAEKKVQVSADGNLHNRQ